MVVLQDGQSIVTRSDMGSNMMTVNLAGLGAGGATNITTIAHRDRGGDMDEFNLAYELNLTDEDDEDDDYDSSGDEEDDDEYFYESTDGEIPVSLAAFVIVLYMFGGAWLFHKFEGWTLTQGFYFSFVTLTTMVS